MPVITSKKTRKTTKTKETKRFETQIKLYEREFCDGIIDKEALYKGFDRYMEELQKYVVLKDSIIIDILPYCSERPVSIKTLDKANNPAIEEAILKIITKKFNINFTTRINQLPGKSNTDVNIITKIAQTPYLETVVTAISRHISKFAKPLTPNQPIPPKIVRNPDIIYSSEYDPLKFYNLIHDKDTLKHIMLNKQYIFIGTHSQFLIELLKLVSRNIHAYFDNLDICQIDLSAKCNIVKVVARHFSNDYKEEPIFDNTNTNVGASFYKLFMMRHCVACHNLLDIKNPIAKMFSPKPAKKVQHLVEFIQGQYGYNKYSLCSPYNITELFSKRDILLNIFKAECDGIDNVIFGSAIILRAIITTILFIYIMKGEPNYNYTDYGFLDESSDEPLDEPLAENITNA